MLTIEEWHGPFDKPRTMLTERDSSGNFLRRFDLTGLEYVEVTSVSFSADPPARKSVEIKERAGLSLEETVRAARLAEEARMKAGRSTWVDFDTGQANRDDHV